MNVRERGEMKKGHVVDSSTMMRLIDESHARSKRFGIDSMSRNTQQECLSDEVLRERRADNDELLQVVLPHFAEFFDLLSPDEFLIAAIDADGYILHITGSELLKKQYRQRNCAPGFKWTEEDVGTTAISMCHKHHIPIQLTGSDHYCDLAHHLTSSSAPIFGEGGELLGILVVSGAKEFTHPHTLYMVTTAARAAERQLRVTRRNKTLALHIGFFDKVIESASTGLLILNTEGEIWKINGKGAQILKSDELEGRHISELEGLTLDIQQLRTSSKRWVNKECWIRCGRGTVPILYTAQAVLSETKELLGAVLVFNEMSEIQKLAENIAGAKAHYTFPMLVGRSEKFLESIDLAQKAADSTVTVLLQGETGTGKELFAQAIHNHGARSHYPFVPINCGAIPAELLESELFGYVEGTFTGAVKGGRPGKFELADGGTILLDEIGDMPHHMQVKLLRVLQTAEVYRIGARKPVKINTRIIASTHVNLSKAVAQGRFREDLYYRLNVLPINIPPLRERGSEDILELAMLFLNRGTPLPLTFSQSAQQALVSYHWPGNVRELENIVQRALHRCEGDVLDAEHFALPIKETARSVPIGTLQDMEYRLIEATLEETNNNMVESARRLGISRATLYRKVEKMNAIVYPT